VATPKKKPTTKRTTAKKPAAKKAPAKTRVASKATRARKQEMQSFKLYKETPSEFKSLRVTRQTIYWTILLAFIMLTQLWILKIQLDIADITNSLTVIQ